MAGRGSWGAGGLRGGGATDGGSRENRVVCLCGCDGWAGWSEREREARMGRGGRKWWSVSGMKGGRTGRTESEVLLCPGFQQRNELAAMHDLQLLEGSVQARFDGGDADGEAVCDLLVVEAVCHECGNFPLSGREAG